MARWLRPVFSSTAVEVGYDSESESLLVVWKNGKVSAYKGVPESTAEQCAKAPSVGSFLHTDIKPYYPHRYVSL